MACAPGSVARIGGVTAVKVANETGLTRSGAGVPRDRAGGLTMTRTQAEGQAGFQAVLAAPGRSPTIPESMDVYGWLVGSWDLAVLRYWGIDVARAASRARSISAGCSRAEPFRTSGSCRGARSAPGTRSRLRTCMAPRFACGIRGSRPGGSPGRIPPGGTTRSRSAVGSARTSSRSALARRHADPVDLQRDHAGFVPWLGQALEPDGKTWKLEGEFRATRRR